MDDLHVVPTADTMIHDIFTRLGCVCGPDVRFEEDGVIVVHHSLDAREQHE